MNGPETENERGTTYICLAITQISIGFNYIVDISLCRCDHDLEKELARVINTFEAIFISTKEMIIIKHFYNVLQPAAIKLSIYNRFDNITSRTYISEMITHIRTQHTCTHKTHTYMHTGVKGTKRQIAARYLKHFHNSKLNQLSTHSSKSLVFSPRKAASDSFLISLFLSNSIFISNLRYIF